MTYTDVFGSATLPPSEYGYASFTLTANATFVWPYNTDGSSYPVAKVMDIACDAGNEVTLPDCTEVSTGEDFLIRNVGANVLIVKDAAGVQVASVAVGAASYFYLTDNTSAAGVFGVIGFGVGTSTADASSLVGYGIKAVGASLNQAHPVQPTNTGITLSTDHRAKLVVFTGGVATFTLDTAATLGDDYFTMFRNDGTGTATIDPAASELIDGMASMQVQPGESLMLICTGTKWYSVGYGRSTLYQFTQLTKDVSAGGTITLSATEAANKLITFIGNPSAAVEVVVPAVAAVYYTQSAVSTAQTITLKTSAGSGVGINQGARVIALCDGTNVVSAQSAVANTSVSLTDGSALVPSLFFATQTNTGLFKSGTQDVGVTVGGSAVAVFGSTGLQTATVGPNSTQRHTLPAVLSDTVTLNTATQTLTNKTFSLGSNTLTGTLAQFNTALSDADFATLAGSETLTDKTLSVDNNTISGIAASSFVLSNASGNIDGSAAQKVIPTGVVVGTTDTQTLTNKTLSSPIISSPTGITKTDVGLGNVDNTSDANKPISTATQAALDLKENAANKGVANGYAALDAAGLVPATQLPSYVDDVLEYANLAAFPVTGEAGKIYVALDTNKTYRWSGSTYIYITSGAVDSVAGKTGVVVLAKADVGLDNVDNTSDANKPISTATQAALDLKANADSPTTTGTFTHSGDVVLSGSGKRITGDFSNATVANQVMFQTSMVSSGTLVGLCPTAYGVSTGVQFYNTPIPGSGINSIFDLRVVGTVDCRLQAMYEESGTPLPMTFWTGGSERMRIGTGGKVSWGSDTNFAAIPSTTAPMFVFDANDALYYDRTNNIFNMMIGSSNYLSVASTGVVVAQPTGLGYGIGAGGTVTQATSKSTTVTLNKPTGQITMNNAALAANTTAYFQVNNSLVAANDLVVLNVNMSSGNYSVYVYYTSAGLFQVAVKNISAYLLSDAVILNFAIIKGAVA